MIPADFEPLFPDPWARGLADLALDFEREAAALGALLHPDVADQVADLLRFANSYFSNSIDGNDITPAGIEAAMTHDWAHDPHRRACQEQARAHVEIERTADEWLDDEATLNPLSADTLLELHRALHENVPPSERWVGHPGGTRRERIVPGALRTFDAQVGQHQPPPAASIAPLLARAAEAYEPARLTGLDRAMAFAASHHRLLWVHPFADGNGLVMRLASRLYARALGIGGTRLWTPARGLARARDRYTAALAEADVPPRNERDDLDERDDRSALSREGLTNFTRFFLTTCLNEVRFMRSVLAPDTLAARLEDYVSRRAADVLPGAHAPLSKAASPLLRHCLLGGRVRRGDIAAITGRSLRAVSTIVGQLLDEGLLVTDSRKGPVRLGLPLHALRYLLPDVYPEGADQWSASTPSDHAA